MLQKKKPAFIFRISQAYRYLSSQPKAGDQALHAFDGGLGCLTWHQHPLDLNPVAVGDHGPMPDTAFVLITQLTDFGIDAKLEQVKFGTWIDDFYGGNQKELMFSNGFCGDGGLNALWGSSGLAYTLGYTNEEAAKMLDETNLMVDVEERDAQLRKAQEWMNVIIVCIGTYVL